MEIKEIYKRTLQNMEHFQFASHVAALCDEANIELVNAVLEPLKQAIEQEDKALNLPRQEEGTKELEQLDRTRDQAYRALQLLTELHLQDDDSATQTAAQRISEVLSRYPKVIQSEYDKESGMIKNLLTDLKAPAMAAHLTKVAAAPYLDRLEKANKAFDQRYRSRLAAAIPTGTYDIKALRAATDKALQAITRRLDSLDDLQPTLAKLPELIAHYNALVDKRRMTLAHRAGTSQAARDKRRAEYDALLKPAFPALEQQLGLPAGSLSFTGKTEGTGAQRHYQLAVKDQTGPDGQPRTLWVGRNKSGSLYLHQTHKPGQSAEPSTDPGQAGSGTGSGNKPAGGGNKPADGSDPNTAVAEP